MPRVISWFSNGAASATATYFAKLKYGDIDAVYCRVREEHPDNLRFLLEFQEVTGIKVRTIMNEQYDGSIYNVFRQRKYIKDQKGGAPCTLFLKKEMRRQYQRPTDVQVFGYTVEEGDRVDRFIDANNEVDEDMILYEKGITKVECKALLDIFKIEQPVMYRLGYHNNNCRGCVKGGMGYWNAVRRDFGDHFEEMSKIEREVGFAINKDKDGMVFLDELDPDRGNFKRDMPGDCGFTCEGNK